MMFYRDLRYRAIALIVMIGGVLSCSENETAEVLEEIPWGPGQKWMVADLHTHTTFSDGALSPSELVTMAAKNQCDVIAITDHSDENEEAATAEYFASINTVRDTIKRTLVIGGLEWNAPPYGGREHVGLLIHPNSEHILMEFKNLFESSQSRANEALAWLQKRASSLDSVVAIYNHPSRKAESVRQRQIDYTAWSQESDVLIGFEGAPGHMNDTDLGSYRAKIKTIDHWDPFAAEINGAWDSMLNTGRNPFGAIASSDYHNKKLDKPPCSFSKIHLLVPERSYSGVFAALKVGAFWAGHGGVLTRLKFSLMAEGLLIPSIPGELVELPKSTPIILAVELERDSFYESQDLVIEIIGNLTSGNPELIKKANVDASVSRFSETFAVGNHSKDHGYVRLRVRKVNREGPDYVAYTNAIRLRYK